MQFPRLVYRSAALYMLADDQAAHDALIADGWFASVPEALAGQHAAPPPPAPAEAQPVDDSPPTRAEMESKATELGIKFDGRWGDKKLLAEIEARL